MLIDHVSTQAIDYVFDHAGPTRQIAQLGSSPSANVGWVGATAHRPVAAATTGVQVLRWTGNEATELLTVYRDASSLGTAAWAAAGAHTINSGALGSGGAYNAVSAAPCDVKIRHAVWFDSIDNARDARVEAFFMSDGGL